MTSFNLVGFAICFAMAFGNSTTPTITLTTTPTIASYVVSPGVQLTYLLGNATKALNTSHEVLKTTINHPNVHLITIGHLPFKVV